MHTEQHSSQQQQQQLLMSVCLSRLSAPLLVLQIKNQEYTGVNTLGVVPVNGCAVPLHGLALLHAKVESLTSQPVLKRQDMGRRRRIYQMWPFLSQSA